MVLLNHKMTRGTIRTSIQGYCLFLFLFFLTYHLTSWGKKQQPDFCSLAADETATGDREHEHSQEGGS